ncbi:MAG: hypothetical protein XD36_3044 [Halomonas sp. 54_146]|nr:hypothetical protein [Halomonas sp. 54_146]KUJ86521.1 MAG: hypothetical protein XD36_3044 [Halomonas sp. 54_146]
MAHDNVIQDANRHLARQRVLSRNTPRQTESPPGSGEPPDGESSA